MKWKFQTAGRLLALLALSGALLAAPLPAQAAPGVLTGLTGTGSKLELELTEMELEITDDDPRPKGYLYTSGQSDYYFIVWMSSNSNVATVDGDGKVTGRNAGTAIITAISDHGERAACKVTVTRKNEESARKKPTLDTTSLSLVLQYNDLHPTHQLQLTNSDHSFLYVYQWMSSNPEVATVSDKGLVTAQAAGTTTITAMVSNGQALRCSVTVTSDIGKVTLNKSDLLLRIVGTQERLTATVAVEGGGSVPITWVSSNPGVVTVDAEQLRKEQQLLLDYARMAVTEENVGLLAKQALAARSAVAASTLAEEYPRDFARIIGLHTYSQSPRRAYDITLTGNWVERGGFRFEEFILTPRREDADHGRTE